MNTIVFAFPGNELLAHKIQNEISAEQGLSSFHHFPDGESLVQIQSEVAGKNVIVVSTLDRPDCKILSLYYLCKKIKTDGAAHLTLIAPYLAYMRQDKSFHPGEAVSSVYFASLLSSFTDRLITIDPHLHRHESLHDIYSIPCTALHSSLHISKWIADHVEKPLLIGPDEESKQWISKVATEIRAPYLVLQKERLGDRIVKISVVNAAQYSSSTPIILDDIISTGHTMMETIKQLKKEKLNPPICMGIHALFTKQSYEQLMRSGVQSVVTCNTIPHLSNQIDLTDLIVESLRFIVEFHQLQEDASAVNKIKTN